MLRNNITAYLACACLSMNVPGLVPTNRACSRAFKLNILYLLFIFTIGISFQLKASDDPFCWKAYPTTTGGQCYIDKVGAINDFMSKGLPYSLMTENFSTVEEDGLIRFNYKMPDELVEVGPWVYRVQNVGVNPLPTYESEEEAFIALQVFLMEQRMSAVKQHPCSPYSEVVPGYDWLSEDSRYGYSYSELRGYEHTYYMGDYWPNQWTYIPCQAYGPGTRHITRSRSVQCPQGSLQFYDAAIQMCINKSRARVSQVGKYGISVPPNICPTESNPCSPATGAKTQTETDYTLANGTLKVQRFYNSQSVEDGYINLGPRWRHNYTQRLNGYDQPVDENGIQAHPYPAQTKSSYYNTPRKACYQGWDELKLSVYGGLLADGRAYYLSGVCQIRHGSEYVLKLPIFNTLNHTYNTGTSYGIGYVSRENGTADVFTYQADQWQPLYPSATTLVEAASGWVFKLKDNTVESYDSDGKLITSTNQNGQTTEFSYDEAGRLQRVTSHYGDTLTYTYNEANQLTIITTPDGDLGYGYDAEGRLVSINYPDNRSRQYHYEDPRFPFHLTGITDENSDRYATWAYDAEGRAILSEHANSAEQVSFIYNPDGTTTVTDAAGAERIYHFVVQQGAMKVDHIEGDRCTTCAGGDTQAYTYDSNGFIASKTDWNGNTTTYTRDDQGRELSRTEASGTPQARTITTTWDVNLNKRLTVTEPEQITEYTYDTEGRLQSQSQSAVQ